MGVEPRRAARLPAGTDHVANGAQYRTIIRCFAKGRGCGAIAILDVIGLTRY